MYNIMYNLKTHMSKIIIITGPSGVGKGTIENELFKINELNLSLSCSVTTRKKRDGEVQGEHYYFIDKEDFINKINNDEFLEYSKHFDNYYGTLKSEVNKLLENGKNVIVEVDTIGAINIINELKDKKENNLISIFIKPPNLGVLEERIRKRNSENDESIKKRLLKAKKEIKQTSYFMFIIINNNLMNSVKEIVKIIKGVNYEL